jgi:hypothetical protein
MARGIRPRVPAPPEPSSPLGDGSARPRRELDAVLTRIDGWGMLAWKEILGCWQLRGCRVRFAPIESSRHVAYHDVDDEPNDVAAYVFLPGDLFDEDVVALGKAEQTALCDWILRLAWRRLLRDAPVRAYTYEPGDRVIATNACYIVERMLAVRLAVRLPMAGMCCDTVAFRKFTRRMETFARAYGERTERRSLSQLLRSIRVQEALRASLPRQGLVAFLADGALLARDRDGAALARCQPFRSQRAQRTEIDLGPLGRYHGLGIRHGVTALAGAPYHGKSTVLRAIADGRWNHRPGDGRERVVSLTDALLVQAEDGRRIKNQDVGAFFSRLPGADARDFSTDQASGATSMAASVLQGIAAGTPLLLIDEDTAAGNFLAIDAGMRRLLGKSLTGLTTLVEALPEFARRGVSTILVAGSNQQSLACADEIILLDHFQPHAANAAARRIAGRIAPRPATVSARSIADEGNCLLGPRNFLEVDVHDPYRPLVDGVALDLSRSGWRLDSALTRGAACAAAWLCRLNGEGNKTLAQLRSDYDHFIGARGVRGLDPFDSAFCALPPWQLVITLLERLPRPIMRTHPHPNR